MTTRVTKSIGTTITVETTIEVGGPILKAEAAIQVAVNEVGAMATVEALKQFDADGEPMMIGGEKSITRARTARCCWHGMLIRKRAAARRCARWNKGRGFCATRRRVLRKWWRTNWRKTRHWMCSATSKRITADRSRNFWKLIGSVSTIHMGRRKLR
jgi:hypothetical protein